MEKKLDINKLYLEKFQLEYQLAETEYHLESIPRRIKLARDKILLALIPLIFSSTICYFCVRNMLIHSDNRMIVFLMMLSNFYCGIIILVTLVIILKQINLFIGSTPKVQNLNYCNFQDEKQNIKIKIDRIKNHIHEIERQISENSDFSERNIEIFSYKAKEIQSLNLENYNVNDFIDNFFNYCFGTWGDERNVIENYMMGSYYENEKDELEEKIKNHYREIKILNKYREKIDSDYEKSKTLILYYAIFMFLVALFQYSLRNNSDYFIYLGLTGIVFGVVLFFMLIKHCEKKICLYKLEHTPQRMKNYALMHHIEPTDETKKKIYDKISDLKHRHEYIEQILAIKNLINKSKIKQDEIK